MQSLSVREKAGQLVLAYPQLNKSSAVEVGGVLFVGKMLHDRASAKAVVQSAKRRAKVPPLFAVDMEGGAFNRMPNHPNLVGFPPSRTLGAHSDASVEEWGRKVGKALSELGISISLSPVLDVASEGHMFDNARAYSGDFDVVRAKASAYARGLKAEGVSPIGKHFPGYGSLSGDSDHERVEASWSTDELNKHAAVFDAASESLGGVMMSNVVYNSVGPSPAILEPELVAMAHQRGWITVTDDLAVGALAKTIGTDSKTVVKRAFLAGNDLLLTTAPPDWDKGVDYISVIQQVAEESPQNMELLNAACRRVLELKQRMGLLQGS